MAETHDLRFRHNASMIIAGPSQSGKTTFILKLLKHRHLLFDVPLKAVHWYYGVYQSEVHQRLSTMGNIHLEEGIPTSFDAIQPYSMIILDDLMTETKASDANVTNLFTRVAHHKNSFVIFVTQNLFRKGGDSRTQHLNAQYLVVFKNPRDSLQIRVLGSQMFPGKKNYLTEVYEDATSRPHGYLLIDSHQETSNDLRLRTKLFLDEAPMIAYQAKL